VVKAEEAHQTYLKETGEEHETLLELAKAFLDGQAVRVSTTPFLSCKKVAISDSGERRPFTKIGSGQPERIYHGRGTKSCFFAG
jgi:hypothetical protein